MIHSIVVIYNTSCEKSITCQTLMAQKSSLFGVIVFDNSESNYGNRGFCEKNGWFYLGGDGNRGLSAAYNRAIEWIGQQPLGYVCLLDDDTALPEGFFEQLQQYIDQNPSTDIFLPILTQGGRIISPTRAGLWNRYFTSLSDCLSAPSEKLQAFNSGMVIKLDVYANYRYDERIFLDGVDHAFIRDMNDSKKKITVVPVQCEQQYSGGQRGTFQGAIARFEIYVRDSRILYENTPLQYWYIVGKRALHLSWMFKTLKFITMLLRTK